MGRSANDYAALFVAALFAAVALLVGSWRLSIKPQPKAALPKEAWERVKEEFPLPQDPSAAVVAPADVFTEVIAANPFSAQRRKTPQSTDNPQGPQSKQANEPPPPKFVYKGRMQLGSRQRAILEDSTIKKTYFLEVGQGVANFKVLDIDEKRVILSDPQTHEEVTVSLTTSALP